MAGVMRGDTGPPERSEQSVMGQLRHLLDPFLKALRATHFVGRGVVPEEFRRLVALAPAGEKQDRRGQPPLLERVGSRPQPP